MLGKSLKQISIELGKYSGYCSGFLIRNNIVIDYRLYPKRVNISQATIDINKLKKCIDQELSATQIAKELRYSYPTIWKYVRAFMIDSVDKLHNNGMNRQHNSMTGKINPRWRANKGKKYEEIYGIENADKMRQYRSKWLKENNIRKFATKISKPQALLYNIVKTDFSTAVLEYEMKVSDKKSIWLDIAIPDKKFALNMMDYIGMK